MQWVQFCRAVEFRLHSLNVLLIHLGSNDLARNGGKALILDVIHDLRWLRAACPAMRILWYIIILGLA